MSFLTIMATDKGIVHGAFSTIVQLYLLLNAFKIIKKLLEGGKYAKKKNCINCGGGIFGIARV